MRPASARPSWPAPPAFNVFCDPQDSNSSSSSSSSFISSSNEENEAPRSVTELACQRQDSDTDLMELDAPAEEAAEAGSVEAEKTIEDESMAPSETAEARSEANRSEREETAEEQRMYASVEYMTSVYKFLTYMEVRTLRLRRQEEVNFLDLTKRPNPSFTPVLH